MPIKRTVTYDEDENLQMKKRLRRVETLARQNKPEMQHITFNLGATVTAGTASVAGITSISQGDLINNRSSDRVRVWRVEVRGITDTSVDTYLLQAHGDVAPVVADFTSQVGAFILDSSLNNRFTEWRHYRNLYAGGAQQPAKFVQRFKKGIIVKYNGTTASPVDNGLYVVHLNRTGSDKVVNLSCRVWYTDA